MRKQWISILLALSMVMAPTQYTAFAQEVVQEQQEAAQGQQEAVQKQQEEETPADNKNTEAEKESEQKKSEQKKSEEDTSSTQNTAGNSQEDTIDENINSPLEKQDQPAANQAAAKKAPKRAAAAVSSGYTVTFSWTGAEPLGDAVTLPVDTGTYTSESAAKYRIYYTSPYYYSGKQITGNDGYYYTFSGWNTSVEGNVVKFTGSWTKTENKDLSKWYKVYYSWNDIQNGHYIFDASVVKPSDSNEYLGVEGAKAAVDTTYTAGTKRAGVNGYYYTFSGWSYKNIENRNVNFTGTWTQTDEKVPAQNYSVKYEWTDADKLKDAQTLPVDDKEYSSYADAQRAVNSTFASSTTKEGTDGYLYRFSGWTGRIEGQQIIFSGKWTKTDKKADEGYKVTFSWTGAEPLGDAVTLPVDTGTYTSESAARRRVSSASPRYSQFSQVTGNDGYYYKFSGWTASVEGNVVKFTGTWTSTGRKNITKWRKVKYTWNAYIIPGNDLTVPTDSNEYLGVEAAKAAVDTALYPKGTKVSGTDGYYYEFSGWEYSADQSYTVYFKGTWTKTEEKDPSKWYTTEYQWTNADKLKDAQTLPESKEYSLRYYSSASLILADDKYKASTRRNGSDGYVYQFSGWKKDVEGMRVKFTGEWIKTDTKIYSMWYYIEYYWIVSQGTLANNVTYPAKTDNIYSSREAATAAVDKTYTKGMELPATNGYYYRFSGWNLRYAGQCVAAGGGWVNTDKKVPSMWYTVTYTDGVDDEEIFADQSAQFLIGTDSDTPAFEGKPSRDSYIFAGWTPEVTTKVTGNVTYTAIWKEDRNHNNNPDEEDPKYTVTYSDGTGNGEVFADQSNQVLSGLDTPAFNGNVSRKGYIFAGWDFDVSKTVTGNVTYTAIWKQDKNENGKPDEEEEYTVSYDPDGGIWSDGTTGIKTVSRSVLEGQKILESPTREGYTFVEWRGSSYQPGEEYSEKDKYDLYTDDSLKAVWKETKTAADPESADSDKGSKKTSAKDTNGAGGSKAKSNSSASSGSNNSRNSTSRAVSKSGSVSKLPRTGDTAQAAGYIGLLIAAAAAIGVLLKRRNI